MIWYFLSLCGLCGQRVEEACCISSAIPAPEHEGHWILSELPWKQNKRAEHLCHPEGERFADWQEVDLVARTRAQVSVLFVKSVPGFFTHFLCIHSFNYEKFIECLLHAQYYSVGGWIGLIRIWWNNTVTCWLASCFLVVRRYYSVNLVQRRTACHCAYPLGTFKGYGSRQLMEKATVEFFSWPIAEIIYYTMWNGSGRFSVTFRYQWHWDDC